ncbi:MAG: PSD1 and planctomycete cytochrome C domain-containing protein, partial [Acidobacteria bacterium]|nr:PSD1 and planctomycete cytochrome C domain-containing protein [Acidobacteriota bacterium]
MRLFVFLALSAPVLAQSPVSFNRDIRPIMADTCFRCHGPDQSSRMANLRLDIREEATKANRAGRTPIVPGNPDQSQIIARVFHANPARLMPPPSAHKELTDKQKDTIRRWVAEGAVYEGHWAYEPIRKPEGKSIDSFVQARLNQVGLKQAPEADRRTLIRRVTLDLTGLPPTPIEVNQFLADKTPNAYEKLVDRLLASKAHAEKMTMHWLDAVRYADTSGFHGDNLYPSWPYRDYVLNSYLNNKPFDVFTREQLAGDLLPNSTTDQKVAAAFNRLNRTSAEGGLQPKEYLAKYGADRVRTVSAVWLGATLGCAECHDHKFDPLLAKDFYAMKAFFADIKETGLVPDRGSKAWGSVMPLPSPEQKQKMDAILARIEAIKKASTPKATDEAWQKQLLADYEAGKLAWKIQRPLTAASQNGATLKIYNEEEIEMMPYVGGILRQYRAPGNGLIVASGLNPDNETYTVTFKPAAGTYTAFGLEVVQDDTLPSNGISRGGDRLVVTEVEVLHGKKALAFSSATSNISDPSWEQPPLSAIDNDPNTGWGVLTYGENKNPFLALRLKEGFTANGNDTITVKIRHDSITRKAVIGRFRVALTSGQHSWPEGTDTTGSRNKDGKNPGGLPEPVVKALRKEGEIDPKTLPQHRLWMEGGLDEIARLEQQRFYLDAAIPKVLATEAVEPAETRILPRGNFLDETGPIVEPAIPVKFGKLNTSGRATRLDLANWIVSKDNPLTARVQVNRMWRLFFGTGITKVLDDFGSQGESPVNLDLLDHLASEFRSDWDSRRLVRSIVLSQTYRQSSVPAKEALEKDPENRLLARQARVRVDAEVVHDLALSSAGLLTERFGGPSVRPYQPEGYLASLNFPKRDYAASKGRDLYARGLYTQWQRTFLHPSLMTFDAPSREECTVNRSNSNTPLQALVLLNDPTYVEASRVFAQKMLSEGGKTLSQQIDWAFERALSRPATAEEKTVLSELHAKNLARFKADPQAARQLLTVWDSPLT